MSRPLAVTASRRLARTLESAPDPRRHAVKILDELVRVEGWSMTERAAIQDFGRWLKSRPADAELRPAVDRLLTGLRSF